MFYEYLSDNPNKVSIRSYNDVYAALHYHRSIELLYVLKGEVSFFVAGQKTVIKKDEIGFIPSYYPHSVDNSYSTRSITFIVPYDYFKEIFVENKRSMSYLKLTDKEVNRRLLRLIREVERSVLKERSNFLIKSQVSLIFANIIEFYRTENITDIKSNLIIGIIDYINNNLKEKISLDMLARQFGYSKYYFSRLFNKSFNCNLSTYLNSLRSAAAEERLKQSGGSVTDILLDSGYNYTSSFYRFKAKKPH